MIDPKALQESLNNLPPYGPEFQHIVSAARLVLAAVPTKDAVEAAERAYADEMARGELLTEGQSHRECLRAALIAAGVHGRAQMPTREEIASIIHLELGCLEQVAQTCADRILALLGDTA
jgi:hypothetical protein